MLSSPCSPSPPTASLLLDQPCLATAGHTNSRYASIHDNFSLGVSLFNLLQPCEIEGALSHRLLVDHPQVVLHEPAHVMSCSLAVPWEVMMVVAAESAAASWEDH